MTKPHYSDAEIYALRDEARGLGDRLDEVLDALLNKVTERLKEFEGTEDDIAVIGGAIAEIESIRDEHRGVGGGGADDHQPAEHGERSNG